MKKKKVHKMHIKNGDVVKVISGREKGEVGVVQQLFPLQGKILVDRINKKTKHLKAKPSRSTLDPKGKVIITEFPIHSSNVMKWDE